MIRATSGPWAVEIEMKHSQVTSTTTCEQRGRTATRTVRLLDAPDLPELLAHDLVAAGCTHVPELERT